MVHPNKRLALPSNFVKALLVMQSITYQLNRDPIKSKDYWNQINWQLVLFYNYTLIYYVVLCKENLVNYYFAICTSQFI